MKRRAPHHRSFRAWVMREYGRPYDPRQIFQKFDQDIWTIIGRRVPDWAPVDDVTEWYAAMVETAASHLMTTAAKSSGEAY